MAFYKQVRASANGLKTNDVIEDVIGLQSLAARLAAQRRRAYTIYRVTNCVAEKTMAIQMNTSL